MNTAQDPCWIAVEIMDESPLTPEAAELFALSDAYAAALYPAESNHMVDARPAGAAARGLLRGPPDTAGRWAVARPCCTSPWVTAATAPATPTATPSRPMRRSSACTCTRTRRGLGLGARILEYLEQQTAARGVRTLRLETGVISDAARGLYEKCGYYQIGPFGDYWNDPLSVFYEKIL